MHYTIDNSNKVIQVSLNGKIIALNDTKELKQELFKVLDKNTGQKTSSPVVFDLTNVDMITGYGLNFLINTYKKCKSKGRKVELRNLNKKIKNIFKLTKLSSLFIIA